jgi:hypothetical protein
MKLSICCLLFGLLLLSPFTSFAQTPSSPLAVPSASIDVPKLVKFSGTAKDESGKLMTGPVGITFSLYKNQQGGSPLWVETQNVQADAAGHYTAMLGSATTEGVPLEVFSSGEAQWLGVQIQGQPAQARVLLVSVPYALKAHEAETLSGRSISDFVLVNKTPSTSPNANNTAAGANGASGSSLPPINNDGPTNFVGANATQIVSVTQKGAGAGLSATATKAAGIVGTITGKSNTAVYGLASNTSKGSNAAGVTGQANTETGPGVAGYTSTPKGTGVLGVASATTGGTGVVGVSNATSGFTSGVYGRSASTSGSGLSGDASATSGNTAGVYGQSASTSGSGVSGSASATSGFANGLFGQAASPGGNGVFGINNAASGSANGVYGQVATSAGNGVVGSNTATTGIAVGVRGLTASPDGIAVIGGSSATTGINYGVWGVSRSPNGFGVVSVNTSTGGHVNLTGPSQLISVFTTKGLFSLDYSGNGDFAGNLNVTGTLTKGSGSFKIDHPLDPANKYLYHSFVESPDMMNVYNGNITTDRHGLATVNLPDYFEALNGDFRYQVTVIGQFAQAIVAKKIASNRFVIRTNKPNVEVSWQVTGIRHDAYADAYRIPTEEDKPTAEQGYYLHPEVFGQPASKSIRAASQKASTTDQLAKASNPNP